MDPNSLAVVVDGKYSRSMLSATLPLALRAGSERRRTRLEQSMDRCRGPHPEQQDNRRTPGQHEGRDVGLPLWTQNSNTSGSDNSRTTTGRLKTYLDFVEARDAEIKTKQGSYKPASFPDMQDFHACPLHVHRAPFFVHTSHKFIRWAQPPHPTSPSRVSFFPLFPRAKYNVPSSFTSICCCGGSERLWVYVISPPVYCPKQRHEEASNIPCRLF